ncbi:hypothetical protein mRhiFer1_009477 [Rhinolophus ferrumequinum]|uniref:Uncharacterized protein n=1 Tax=Rhinolophus ferrumequinum TaxID=59479 RepID=A0A7J7REL0_RHIFE|nr:hypothetical protein mRhiFer1_009477 [Rhinolophus ferrumequinum]
MQRRKMVCVTGLFLRIAFNSMSKDWKETRKNRQSTVMISGRHLFRFQAFGVTKESRALQVKDEMTKLDFAAPLLSEAAPSIGVGLLGFHLLTHRYVTCLLVQPLGSFVASPCPAEQMLVQGGCMSEEQDGPCRWLVHEFAACQML